jgi:Epoxide hydrolase N terminus
VEPFRIHVADEVLNDLRARLRQTRWPDQIPGIGWEQGTELDWLRRLVSYWAHEFDWRGWERRLNAFNHFTWEGIHFVYQRAASGRGVPLILTHGWPSSFLDYVDMLPMLSRSSYSLERSLFASMVSTTGIFVPSGSFSDWKIIRA